MCFANAVDAVELQIDQIIREIARPELAQLWRELARPVTFFDLCSPLESEFD